MKYVVFKSDKKINPFSPQWDYFICEFDLQGIDFAKISQLILSKEKHIIESTLPKNDHAYYTELSSNSLTSRSHTYNFFNLFKDPEITKLKQAVSNNYLKMMQDLKLEVPDTWIFAWANVMRKGEEIKPHLHCVKNWSYLSGHITVQCKDTATVYINPINQINDPEIYSAKNKVGSLSFFQSNIPHYTTKHEADSERITIAFDLFANQSPHFKDDDLLI